MVKTVVVSGFAHASLKKKKNAWIVKTPADEMDERRPACVVSL